MADFNVRILKSSEYDLWDDFAQNSPQGTLFATSDWLVASGSEFRIYGVFLKNKLVAGVPLTARKLAMGIKSAEHPPLTPYLGVLHQPQGQKKYVSQITQSKEIHRDVAAKLKTDFDMIRLNFHPGDVDLQPYIWEGFETGVRYTYLANISDLDRAWESMENRRRNDIHRAQRDGIYVKPSNSFEDCFALVEKTFERQEMTPGFRNAAIRYYELLSQRDQCKPFVAFDPEDHPIAVVFLVWDDKCAYYLLGGYDPERGHTGASALAMWTAIQHVAETLGLKQFDFEGSMVQPVEQFFRKFGGQHTPYYSIYWAKPHIDLVLKIKSGLPKAIKGIFRR